MGITSPHIMRIVISGQSYTFSKGDTVRNSLVCYGTEILAGGAISFYVRIESGGCQITRYGFRHHN